MPQIAKEPPIRFKPTKQTLANIAAIKEALGLRTTTAAIEAAIQMAAEKINQQ